MCGEIALLKDEIRKLRDEVKNLKQSLQSAEEEIQSLQENQKETSAQVKENNEDIDFLFEDIEALRRRNIKLEAYTRRENVRIFNVGEEEDENTEELVRNVFVANLKIPADKVNDIRFERVHRISTNNSSLRAPSYPKPIIARFSHYQDKEYVGSFYKKEPTSVSQIISRKKFKKFIATFIQCLKRPNSISKKPSLILINWLSVAKYTEEKKLKTISIIVKWQKIINALISWSVSNWTVNPRPLDVKKM